MHAIDSTEVTHDTTASAAEVEGALPERTLPERPAMPLMPAPQGQETFSPPPSFSPPASGYECAPASA